jgi:hypothetical protein
MSRWDWTRDEVELIVADYFAMLEAELSGEAVNKAEHNPVHAAGGAVGGLQPRAEPVSGQGGCGVKHAKL